VAFVKAPTISVRIREQIAFGAPAPAAPFCPERSFRFNERRMFWKYFLFYILPFRFDPPDLASDHELSAFSRPANSIRDSLSLARATRRIRGNVSGVFDLRCVVGVDEYAGDNSLLLPTYSPIPRTPRMSRSPEMSPRRRRVARARERESRIAVAGRLNALSSWSLAMSGGSKRKGRIYYRLVYTSNTKSVH